MEASGARVGRMDMAGRLQQSEPEAREQEDRTAVNGGNVRYHGGSAAAGGAVEQTSVSRPSDD